MVGAPLRWFSLQKSCPYALQNEASNQSSKDITNSNWTVFLVVGVSLSPTIDAVGFSLRVVVLVIADSLDPKPKRIFSSSSVWLFTVRSPVCFVASIRQAFDHFDSSSCNARVVIHRINVLFEIYRLLELDSQLKDRRRSAITFHPKHLFDDALRAIDDKPPT